jgi:hypothetical protein
MLDVAKYAHNFTSGVWAQETRRTVSALCPCPNTPAERPSRDLEDSTMVFDAASGYFEDILNIDVGVSVFAAPQGPIQTPFRTANSDRPIYTHTVKKGLVWKQSKQKHLREVLLRCLRRKVLHITAQCRRH